MLKELRGELAGKNIRNAYMEFISYYNTLILCPQLEQVNPLPKTTQSIQYACYISTIPTDRFDQLNINRQVRSIKLYSLHKRANRNQITYVLLVRIIKRTKQATSFQTKDRTREPRCSKINNDK